MGCTTLPHGDANSWNLLSPAIPEFRVDIYISRLVRLGDEDRDATIDRYSEGEAGMG